MQRRRHCSTCGAHRRRDRTHSRVGRRPVRPKAIVAICRRSPAQPRPAGSSARRISIVTMDRPTRCAPTDAMSSGPSSCRFRPLGARYVRGIEFRPGNARVVHHANIGVDRTRSSRRLDEADAEPGYVGGMVPDASYPPGYMLGWTPGQRPRPSPSGMAWRLEPGKRSGRAAAHAADGQARTAAGERRVLLHRRSAGRRADRSAAGQRDDRDCGRRPPTTRSPTATCCRSTSISSACSRTRTISAGRMEADGDACRTARSTPLITIADWDFRWQDVYRYETPIALPKGTRHRRCASPTTTRPRIRAIPLRPPRAIVWGQNTSDEMGDLWLQLVPRRRERLRRAGVGDITRKTRVEDLAAYTKIAARRTHQPAAPRRRRRRCTCRPDVRRRPPSSGNRCASIRSRRRRTTTSGSRCR